MGEEKVFDERGWDGGGFERKSWLFERVGHGEQQCDDEEEFQGRCSVRLSMWKRNGPIDGV